MFQRRPKRQAGFIRNKNSRVSVHQNQKSQRYEHKVSKQTSCSFSPFKDASPQPFIKLLLSQRNSYCHKKQTNPYHTVRDNHSRKPMKLNKKQSQIVNRQEDNIILEQQLIFKKHKSQQYDVTHPNKYQISQHRPTQNNTPIQTEQQQIYIIKQKPCHFQPQITLAQSFNIHCKDMRNRLQQQRRKFSKSLKKYDDDKISNAKSVRKSAAVNFDQSRTRKKQRNSSKMMAVKSVALQMAKVNVLIQPVDSNKQNVGQLGNKKLKNIEIPQQNISAATGYFLPVQTCRSKPITPRQAYNHSFKKWKQLPQVMQKQKQKQKQQQLRQRLCRVRAHSLEVRKKMRK